MPNRKRAHISDNSFVIGWLTEPGRNVSPYSRPILLAQLLTSPVAVMMGAIDGLFVSIAAYWRREEPEFAIFMVLEVLIMAGRLGIVRQVRRCEAAHEIPLVDWPIALSILWCALQGALAFAVMQTDDTALMVLSTALIMAIIGPLCARNYAAPRLALLLVLLCVLPFVAGAAMAGDPWLLLLIPMTPIFLVGMDQIVRNLQRILVETLAAEERYAHLAEHDQLTGLLNRHGLEAALSGLSSSENGSLAILCLDLDRFKQVNDGHGHGVGDKLLIEVGSRITRSLRPTDIVARTGGDEFMIVIANLGPGAVELTAERLVATISYPPYPLGKSSVTIGASVGYACLPEDAQTIEELRSKADAALYAAKSGGRGMGQRYVSRLAGE